MRYSQTSTNVAARAIALYRSMLRDIPVLASAADLPLVAWSQRPETLPTQISPKASAILVVSLCRKSFRVLAILAWIAALRRALFARRATARDHVHALMFLPPNLDLSRFVNNLKTTSSRLELQPRVRRDFADQLRRVFLKPVF